MTSSAACAAQTLQSCMLVVVDTRCGHAMICSVWRAELLHSTTLVGELLQRSVFLAVQELPTRDTRQVARIVYKDQKNMRQDMDRVHVAHIRFGTCW